jgi:hypothetical protein
VEKVVSRKRGYDYTASNDDQPSTSAESSKAAAATTELEPTRRMSLRTKKAVNDSELDVEVVANSSLMSETGGNKAVAAPLTTSNNKKTNGAKKRAAAESTEKAAYTVTDTPLAEKSTMLEEQCRINDNGQAKKKQRHAAAAGAQVRPISSVQYK